MKFKWYEIGYILLGAVCIFYFATKTLFYNPDMSGYIASVYKSQGFNKQETYKRTYEDIAKNLNHFNIKVINLDISLKDSLNNSKKVDGLWTNILFFKIRILYIKCMKLVGKFNFSYTEASYIVSALFAALLFVTFCFMIKKIEISIFTSILLFSLGIMTIARLSTPDSLACFFVLLICLLYLSNYVLLSFILAALLPLARTDYAIFSVIFSLLNYSKYQNTALIPVLAVPLVFIINNSIGNLGYLHLFNYEFIYKWRVLAQDIIISTNPLTYLTAYFSSLIKFPYSVGCITLFLSMLSIKIDGFDKKIKKDLILICCILTFICSFLLFPSCEIRRHFSFCSIMMIISIAKIHNKIGSLNIIEIIKNSFVKSSSKS